MKKIYILSLFIFYNITCNSQNFTTYTEFKKSLNVPYVIQPTWNTCQATCLKMYAMYLDTYGESMFEFGDKSVEEIYNEINTGFERPINKKNSWTNFVWWLNKTNGYDTFHLINTPKEEEAIDYITSSIDLGYPVLVSTNHLYSDGHIILVIGYSISDESCEFICHDPYGEFHPELLSEYFSETRYSFAQTNSDGSNEGVGKAINLTLNGIKRLRRDSHNSDKFILIGKKHY